MSDTNVMAVHNGGTSWTRNTNCIIGPASGYDTTGICLNIAGVGNIGATLISNRHFIFNTHTGIAAGNTLYFVNNSNTTFAYTVDNVQMIGPYGQGYTDISIGYFTTTVDASLTYYKVFPSTFENYLQFGSAFGVPIVYPYMPLFYMDQEKKFLCGDLKFIISANPPADQSDVLKPIFSYDTARYNNSEPAVGGDSGNILFAPINNEIVLLGGWYTGTAGSKSPGNVIGSTSCIYKHISAINSAMTSLAGTSYQLTQFDLSGYQTYP